MSLRDLLIHKCKIETFTETRLATGELAKTWTVTYANIRCRLVIKAEQHANESLTTKILSEYKLILPAGVTIDTLDRISDVRYWVSDDLLDAGPFEVEAVLPRHARSLNHVTVMLEKVT